MTVNVPQALEALLSKKRIFNSEADLQFALAWQIQTQYPQAKIYLEYVPWKYNAQMHFDIVVCDGDIMIPIELKYKTKGFSGIFEDQNIVLKNHGAQDHGRYDFLKDIERLEGFCGCEEYTVGTGYAIFLTNDSKYWTSSDKKSIDKDFHIEEGKVISGELRWSDKAGDGSTKGRSGLTLKGRYQIIWKPYELAEGIQFKYTIIAIDKYKNT